MRTRVGAARRGPGAAGRPRGARRDRSASSRSSASCAAGVTADRRTTVKSPSATLSTAEAISVMTNGLALAAHFGDGVVRAADVAAGLVGAVVKDPVQDRIVWQEYLETVVKDRARVGRPLPGVPRAGLSGREHVGHRLSGPRRPAPRPGSARSVAGALDELRPDLVLIEGPPELDAVVAAGSPTPSMRAAGGRRWSTPSTSPGGRRSTRSRSFSPEWVALRWALAHGVAGALRRPARRPTQLAGTGEPDESRRTRRPGQAHPSRPDRRCSPRGGLRRPRALVGGRRRAPRTSLARRSSRAVRGRDGGGPRERRPARRRSRRRRERAPRGGHAPRRPGRRQGGPRADRRRLRRLPRPGPRPGALPARRPRQRAAQGPAAGQGRRHLGAVDVRPAGPWPAATAPASTSPGWYQHLFDHWAEATTGPADWLAIDLARPGGPRAARRAARRVHRPRSSRPSGWPTRWPPCGAGPRSGWPS